MVPLKVFEDEQSRLQHEIRRLTNQIKAAESFGCVLKGECANANNSK